MANQVLFSLRHMICGFTPMTQSQKKIDRKKRRILSALKACGDIGVSDEPSACVLVGNAGLATGDSLESVVARFPRDHAPIDVLMPPARHFSLLKFTDEATARSAVDIVEASDSTRPVYLFYLPPHEFARVAKLSASCVPPFRTPSGARLVEEFVSEQEERAICDSLDWSNADWLKQRRVMHFGHVFDYSTNGVSRTQLAPPLPAWSRRLIGRLLEMGVVESEPDQLTINGYEPGQGIPAHVDTHSAFSECLVCVSLLSACTMQFDTVDAERDTCWLRLPRRSALLLAGEARYRWRHAIGARRYDVIRSARSSGLTVVERGTRVSLTFRRLMPDGYVCRCPFPLVCDSQQQMVRSGDCSSERSTDCNPERSALELERVYVSEVYERIAEHFSHTRHTPWPAVARFVRGVSSAGRLSLLLDIGCGNGRNLALSHGRVLGLGVDASSRLCSVAAVTPSGDSSDCIRQVVVGSCVRVPLRCSVADCVICVAVLHHLASRQRRVAALAEMARLLAPGARALVTVWAREQRRSAYVTAGGGRSIPEGASEQVDLPLPVHVSRTEFQQQDVLVPWKLQPPRKPRNNLGGAQSRSNPSKDLEVQSRSNPCKDLEVQSRNNPSTDLEVQGKLSADLGEEQSRSNPFTDQEVQPRGKSSTDLEVQPRGKPSTDQGEVQLRYYHVYCEGELEEEVSAVEGVQIIESYYDQGNWCVIFEKSVQTDS